MPLILGAQSATAGGGFEVTNSCRFNKADSPYLEKTQSAGNRDKWSFSVWFKVAQRDGVIHYLLGAKSDASNYTVIEGGDGSDYIRFGNLVGGGYDSFKRSNQILVDNTAWYHMLCVYDSGNADSSLRQLVYLNGTQITSFGSDTTTTLNQDSFVNDSGSSLWIGNLSTELSWFDGLMAEVVLLDGTAASPTDFGEFDPDSPTQWRPIDVSGLAFGTNGFYLDFKDSANLGNDANGGTDFTESGIDASDQSTDSPSNNFATFQPLIEPNANTYSQGNCVVTASSSVWNSGCSTVCLNKGKWYAEFKLTTTNYGTFGVARGESLNLYGEGEMGYIPTNGLNDSIGWYNGGADIKKNGSAIFSGIATYTAGDIVCIALDLDNGGVYFRKADAAWENSADPTSGASLTGAATIDVTSGNTYFIGGTTYTSTSEFAANFGGSQPWGTLSSANQDANGYGNFEYAVPTGYYAQCSRNIGEFG